MILTPDAITFVCTRLLCIFLVEEQFPLITHPSSRSVAAGRPTRPKGCGMEFNTWWKGFVHEDFLRDVCLHLLIVWNLSAGSAVLIEKLLWNGNVSCPSDRIYIHVYVETYVHILCIHAGSLGEWSMKNNEIIMKTKHL